MEKHQIQYQTVRFNLNGKDVERTVDVRASLTDMLRNDFRMTSVKKGCEVGECGACNVLIDGEAFNSCIYLAVWAEGKRVRTLEGLLGPNGELSDIQQAFVDEAAIQCGFCSPGFILTAVEKVAINWGKENQEWLSDLTVEQAKEYIAQEQFAKGSMLPKVEAAIRFAQSGEGRHALITLLDKAAAGIAGETGTVIHS